MLKDLENDRGIDEEEKEIICVEDRF